MPFGYGIGKRGREEAEGWGISRQDWMQDLQVSLSTQLSISFGSESDGMALCLRDRCSALYRL